MRRVVGAPDPDGAAGAIKMATYLICVHPVDPQDVVHPTKRSLPEAGTSADSRGFSRLTAQSGEPSSAISPSSAIRRVPGQLGGFWVG